MNCEQIKERVSIREVLESFNSYPAKENCRTAFYFALDRKENTPSLSVDFVKNTAFDFGTGKSYDVISIVQQINGCSVSDALQFLKKFDFSFSHQIDTVTEIEKRYEIIEIKDVQHIALNQYLKSRKVFEQKGLVKEIHYELNGRKYFGIGFLNNSGGIEIRNKYSKLCLGKKDVTLLKNEEEQGKDICIFEGFFDYLSYEKIKIKNDSNTDFLILNSTAMLFKVEDLLKYYNKISLFLDNDISGKTTKQIIQKKYKNVEDCSFIYKCYKDFNEWICSQ